MYENYVVVVTAWLLFPEMFQLGKKLPVETAYAGLTILG